MRESKTTIKTASTEVKLAYGLLEIAHQSMPDIYFSSDSRCKLAKKVLKENKVRFVKL